MKKLINTVENVVLEQLQGMAAAHPDLRVLLTVAEYPYRIIARRSAGIARVTDLRGKRVGTQLESSAEFFLDAMLRAEGLTTGDVRLVPFMAHTDSPVSRLPAALRANEIDAVALWEPQASRAQAAVGDDAIELYDPVVYSEKFNLCTTQARLEDAAMRTRIVALVKALIDSTRRLKVEPERGWRLVAEAAGLDIATVRAAWPYVDYPGTLAAERRVAVWQGTTGLPAGTSRDDKSRTPRE